MIKKLNIEISDIETELETKDKLVQDLTKDNIGCANKLEEERD